VASETHPYPAKASFDGGTLDCGSGLLLLIRQHIDPLAEGELLEIRSAESSVCEDLPAWCRMTGNALVSEVHGPGRHSFLVAKGRFEPVRPSTTGLRPYAQDERTVSPATESARPERSREAAESRGEIGSPAPLPSPAPAPAVRPLSVMGVGSWPRPRWLLEALHARLEGRLAEAAFEETADDAVRLALRAQLDAGVDVVTDGEQRRDSYASFVGARLDNCQLVPITDLLAYVTDPAEFERELRALDVPAAKVRHPAVLGPLSRSRPLAVHELDFVRRETDRPVKVALPGPYLLSRTLWMECLSDRFYADRASLARDVVRALREEVHALLAAGAALVQLDEPILSEVVFGGSVSGNRTFMCGVLDARGRVEEELAFAERLLAEVTAGLPPERLALHVCRGNWSPDESVALSGDYRPLLGLLSRAPVGTLFLELATSRAGDVEVLAGLPAEKRLGVGVLNQKRTEVETAEEIVARAERAIRLLGPERVLLNPDCGFATFADNPITSARVAQAKLAAAVDAARRLREKYAV
jgi:5-methyltetrahydropteroyltriglutamate--homocysteine methyltransferase